MVNIPHEEGWGHGDAPLWFVMVSYSRGCFLLDLTAHPTQLFQLSAQGMAGGPPHLSLHDGTAPGGEVSERRGFCSS